MGRGLSRAEEVVRNVALREVASARVGLTSARQKYESAMLRAVDSGANFTELARAIRTSEPAARGFVRRARKRRSKSSE